MAEQTALARLREATDVESLRSAILAAAFLNTPDNPAVQTEMRAAYKRLSRHARMQQLNQAPADLVEMTPERRKSSDERLRLMIDLKNKQYFDVPLEATEKAMKDICYDNRCVSCASTTPAYQAICTNFTLDCLRVRITTLLAQSKKNGYTHLKGWPSGLTAELERYVSNPSRFWLDETDHFYSLGDRLFALHKPVIKPAGRDEKSKYEAGQFKVHSRSIQKVIRTFRNCDAGILP
jgi:hypothetical protein